MRFYVIDSKNYSDVSICHWENSGYGSDHFHSFESDNHEYDYDLGAYPITLDAFGKLLDWWDKTLENANNGLYTNFSANTHLKKLYLLLEAISGN